MLTPGMIFKRIVGKKAKGAAVLASELLYSGE
jgi:hypothetical protein